MARMKIGPIIAIGAVGGLAFMAMKGNEFKTMVKGGTYHINGKGIGDEDTNWKSLAQQLQKSGAISNVFIKGKGTTRTVSFTLRPQGRVKVDPGKIIFQMQGVNIILESATPIKSFSQADAIQA